MWNEYSPDYEEDILTLKEFKSCVEQALFTDDDGSCAVMKKINEKWYKGPNTSCSLFNIPEDTSHIIWFNK